MKHVESDSIELCKVGDVLYKVTEKVKTHEIQIKKITITSIRHYPHCVYIDDENVSYFNRTLEKSCFETEEEAIAEVNRRLGVIEKRELLKEYEKELNKKFNLEDHFIIK